MPTEQCDAACNWTSYIYMYILHLLHIKYQTLALPHCSTVFETLPFPYPKQCLQINLHLGVYTYLKIQQKLMFLVVGPLTGKKVGAAKFLLSICESYVDHKPQSDICRGVRLVVIRLQMFWFFRCFQ